MAKKEVCPECSGKIYIGYYEKYCKNCGLVIDDKPFNFGREFFETDPESFERRTRTGSPITWLNPDLRTTFWVSKNPLKRRY